MIKVSCSNPSGLAAMMRKAERIKALSPAMGNAAASAALKLAEDGLASQRAPSGRTWRRKADGQGFKWQTKARVILLKVQGRGLRAELVVEGPEWVAFQQRGWRTKRAATLGEFLGAMARKAGSKSAHVKRGGGPARRILPRRVMPRPWAARIVDTLQALFGRWARG